MCFPVQKFRRVAGTFAAGLLGLASLFAGGFILWVTWGMTGLIFEDAWSRSEGNLESSGGRGFFSGGWYLFYLPGAFFVVLGGWLLCVAVAIFGDHD